MASIEKICGVCSRRFVTEQDYLKGTDQWKVCSAGSLWFNCSCHSTLMIPKGKHDWYSPSLQMSGDALSVFNRMATNVELPHISSAVMDLTLKLEDPELGPGDLAVAVKADPFISAEVLRICASKRRFDGSGASVDQTSLPYAIAFIGKQELKSLVLVASMRHFKYQTRKFNPQAYWSDAFRTAIIAEFLWQKVYASKGKDRAFLAACLCNSGKLVSAIAFPQAFDVLWEQLKNPKTQNTWQDLERASFLPSHITLGEIGSAFWGFPRFVAEAIRYHHKPLEDDFLLEPKLCRVVCLANNLLHWLNLEPHRMDEVQMDEDRRYCEISKGQLDLFVNELSSLLDT